MGQSDGAEQKGHEGKQGVAALEPADRLLEQEIADDRSAPLDGGPHARGQIGEAVDRVVDREGAVISVWGDAKVGPEAGSARIADVAAVLLTSELYSTEVRTMKLQRYRNDQRDASKCPTHDQHERREDHQVELPDEALLGAGVDRGQIEAFGRMALGRVDVGLGPMLAIEHGRGSLLVVSLQRVS